MIPGSIPWYDNGIRDQGPRPTPEPAPLGPPPLADPPRLKPHSYHCPACEVGFYGIPEPCWICGGDVLPGPTLTPTAPSYTGEGSYKGSAPHDSQTAGLRERLGDPEAT